MLQEFKEQGNDCIMKKRDFKGAVHAYTNAIKFLKTNYIYYNNRAAALLLAGDYDKAIEDCDTSLAIKENIKAYTRKASALGELGKFDSAFDCISKALNIDPHCKETLGVQHILIELREEKIKSDANCLISSGKKMSHDVSSTKQESKESITPRVVPADRIKLDPLKEAGAVRRIKKQLSNGLTYSRDNNTHTIDVMSIGLPGSHLVDNGKILRLHSRDIEKVTGSALSLPLLDLPMSLFDTGNVSPAKLSGADKVEKALREYLKVRGGEGCVFRAKNERSSKIGGLCIWKYGPANKNFDCIACWNPFEYCNSDDWRVGDKVHLLDYLPSLFMKINRCLSEVRIENGEKELCRISKFAVMGNATLSGVDDVNFANFGQCGVIGDLWGPLKLETGKRTIDCGAKYLYLMTIIVEVTNDVRSPDGTFELIGIRTDCIKLPFSVEIKRKNKEWEECLANAFGPFVDVNVRNVTSVRIVWRSTDMHLLDGLCSARAGGGLHVEVIGARFAQ